MQIKIARFRNNGSKIFTGRDNGIEARKELGVEQLDANDSTIEVIVPTDTWGINPSFFGGMFEESIKKMGLKFEEKFQFIYPDGTTVNDSLKRDIRDDIDHVIRNIKVQQ